MIPPSDFLTLVSRRERGRLKVYVGSAAGVGKSYRMLQEAHAMRRRGIDVVVGFIETHGRDETAAQQGDLEVVSRRQVPYRTVVLDEMDVDAIVHRRPQVAIVDELAHTNVPGSRHDKRWQDVVHLLDEGISVISAVNVQHLESLNDIVAAATGVTVRETIPDWLLTTADEVVTVDLSAEDLQQRLREGRIYHMAKVPAALSNFFTAGNLATLRELALREVARSVDRTREAIVRREEGKPSEAKSAAHVVVALASDTVDGGMFLRSASRFASRLHAEWSCVYVQSAAESADRIATADQRVLVKHMQLAQTLGAEVVTLQSETVVAAIEAFAIKREARLVIVGAPRVRRRWWWQRPSVAVALTQNRAGIDVLVLGTGGARA
jgi:two-component system sensor histidine kinase KdpD